MSSPVSLTRRDQLEGLLTNLITATYERLGARKKAEAKLKETSMWKRREAARVKANRVVQKLNKKIEAANEEVSKIAEALGPIKHEDEENYNADNDDRKDLSVGINVCFVRVSNPIKSLDIGESEGKMMLHFGTNSSWKNTGKHSCHVTEPKAVLVEETIGSAELLALIADLKAEFTAALSEKDLLAVLIRAKADLGKLK